ncbi:transmembrane protein 135 [Nilaparvata lugens]|uniref:transmembrane protein 135 n=1 Tax=Nilaparvata lugens TaxID=108931 RepID=UPI000B99A1F4|nr:transmembrane protein 135 [Nilaparvata lugens]
MTLISKFKLKTIDVNCASYVHPWTQSCSDAWAELFLFAFQDALRINTTAYLVALLMRGRVPSKKDIKHTILGIIQSSIFLSCHAFGYSVTLCTLRKCLGGFNVLTASFIPSFLSSICAILIERPSRRSLLSLYVTNVASETLFHMCVWRGWLKPIKYGEVFIFTVSVAFLSYCYRSKHNDKDSIYSLLRFFIGPCEENGYTKREVPQLSDSPSKKRNIFLQKLSNVLDYIKKLKSQPSCPHNHSCTFYSLQGFSKLFLLGYGLQISLNLLLQMKRILRKPSMIRQIIFKKDTLRLGAFFGGFSALYRAMSCLLRWQVGFDDELLAVPAGVVGGLAFCFFRDNTVALYMMWKSLQILYNVGTGKGYVPELPQASIFFHCLSTAVLFHAALLEPHNLRSSYWKFLCSMSGGRIIDMDRVCLDSFGLQSTKSLESTLRKHKMLPRTS